MTAVNLAYDREDRRNFVKKRVTALAMVACVGSEKEAFAATAAPGSPAYAALPMFKPTPRAQAATVVGNYAVQISFTDGHSTGIYSYDHLRTICPCAECGKAFRSVPSA